MQLEEIKKKKQQLYQIAAKHGISRIYVFGSVARGESKDVSDIDFLIEMDENVSALGVGAFQYEVQQMLGIKIDVIPTFACSVRKSRFSCYIMIRKIARHCRCNRSN